MGKFLGQFALPLIFLLHLQGVSLVFEVVSVQVFEVLSLVPLFLHLEVLGFILGSDDRAPLVEYRLVWHHRQVTLRAGWLRLFNG